MRIIGSPGRHLPKRVAIIALAISAFVFFCEGSVFARGGFSGGGFKSAPSFRSTSARSFSMPRLSSPGSGFTWGSRQPKAVAKPQSAGSAAVPRSFGASGAASTRSVYDAARSKGTLFASREEATSSFSRSLGSRYASTFASEPATRPTWIPNSTLIGGRSVNIVYNPALGGYGYLDPLLGTWILYDAMRDAAMMDRLMAGNGYYWGPPPVYAAYDPGFITVSIVLLVVVMLIAFRAGRRRGGWGP